MDPGLAGVLGVLLSLPYLYVASRRDARGLFAAGLVIAAAIYIGFAVFGGAGVAWTFIEIGGVVVFGLFAWLGYGGRLWWLAAGWALHVGWDWGLHGSGPGAEFTPGWYPMLCIGFDLTVALGIGMLARRRWQARPGGT